MDAAFTYNGNIFSGRNFREKIFCYRKRSFKSIKISVINSQKCNTRNFQCSLQIFFIMDFYKDFQFQDKWRFALWALERQKELLPRIGELFREKFTESAGAEEPKP